MKSRVLVTNGPFIRAELGSNTNGSFQLGVRIEAAPWIDVNRVRIIANGRPLITKTLRTNGAVIRLDREFRVRAAPSGETWFVVEATGSETLEKVLPGRPAKPFAMTNALWTK